MAVSLLRKSFLDKRLDGRLGGGRDNGAQHLAVLEEHQRGNGVDAEALDELRLLVVVDLAGDERVGVLFAHLVKGRGNTAAVGAPLCPEVHQHGLVRAENVVFKAVGRNGKHYKILLFLCKKLCFNICNRNVREIGGALLVHLPVQRVHHARHTGANGAVPVNVAAVPRAVHKAGIYRLRHLPERKGCGVGAKAIAAVQTLPGLHHSRLFQPRQHPADAGGVGADVLRQRLAAERASAVAQADQRVDCQIKGAVHNYPSFTSS